MRLTILAIMGLMIIPLVGCCGDEPELQREDARCTPRGYASAILFDRHPGPFDASDFNYRSDWPATDAFYSPGQVIYFTERFIDHQGRGFHDSDYVYRRFDTLRVGVGYR